MPNVDNHEIARTFDELADLLELGGDTSFKLRAYRNFAEAVRELGEPLTDVFARGELSQMEGVGPAIAAKVADLLATGTFGALERARAAVPVTLLDLLKLPGFGPKTVRVVWQGANVTTLEQLVLACERGELAALQGVGKKKEARAQRVAQELLEGAGTTLLHAALDAKAAVEARLVPGVAREVVLSGDARRGKALSGDVVVLARGATREQVLVALAAAEPELEMLPPAEHAVAVVTRDGARVLVRAVADADWVHELVTSTGSDAHVQALEEKAGGAEALRRAAAGARDEHALYEALGLPYTPPELRERPDCAVPTDLVDHLSGVFHVHTFWSDGKATILDMARAAAELGFAFIGISEHSKAASYANGLDEARLQSQKAEIAEARALVPNITFLHGVEVDILPDGALDLADAALAQLDFVIASVHARLDMPLDEMTQRIVRAVSHPLVTILGHPTGRLLRARRGFSFDLGAVAAAAAANDTYLEINGNAHRLDLSDTMARDAATYGAKFVVNPDAHSPDAVADVFMGLAVARRAGLSRGQVLNAQPKDALLRTLVARRDAARGRLGLPL
jgi:DNA polymerase (family X)